MDKNVLYLVTFLRKKFNQLIEAVRSIKFQPPEIQKVEITNPSEKMESVSVTNIPEMPDFNRMFVDLEKTFESSIKSVVAELKKKPSDDGQKLLKKLNELKQSFESIDVQNDFSSIINEIKKINVNREIDWKPFVKQVETIVSAMPDLSNYARHDEIKVFLNDNQLTKLTKALQISVSTTSGGGGGNEVLRSILTAVNSRNLPTDLTYTSYDPGITDGNLTLSGLASGKHAEVYFLLFNNWNTDLLEFDILEGSGGAVKFGFGLAKDGGLVSMNLPGPWVLASNTNPYFDRISGGAASKTGITFGYKIVND